MILLTSTFLHKFNFELIDILSNPLGYVHNIKPNNFSQEMLVLGLTLFVVMTTRSGAELDVSTVVGCAACRYASWPHDAWECDVKCNVAPSGVLTYGK